MAIHPPTCRCSSYGCRRRREGLPSLASAATPSRKRHQPFRDPERVNHNSWERGVSGERRPDGSFMPYLDGGRRIGVKEFGDRRRELTEARRALAGPAPTGDAP